MKCRLICLCAIVSILLTLLMPTTYATKIEQSYTTMSSFITSPSAAKASDYSTNSNMIAKLNSIFSGNIGITTSSGAPVNAALGTSNLPDNGVALYACDRLVSGTSCWIYGNAVYYTLFSDVVANGEMTYHCYNSEKINGTISAASYDVFKNAGVREEVGAYVRTTTHSFVILSYTTGGIAIIEGNANGAGLVRISNYSWSEFNTAILSNGNRPIQFIVQPTDAYYQATYPKCDHKYVGCGICKYCNYRFPWEDTKSTRCAGTYKVTAAGGTYPRPDSPYSDAAKSGTLFPQNAKVSVSYSVQNAYGNTWYYCTYNGVSGFVNSSNLTLDSYYTQKFTCVMTSPAEGEVVPKDAYPVVGTLTSQYYKIKEVKAYIDGSCYATVSNVNATSLELRPTDVNYNLDFAALSTGRHVLRIDAKDEKSSSFVTVLNRTFYTEQKEQHTHSYSSAVTTEPTCTTAGVRTYTCSCGASYTETIAALGHVWGTWRTTVNPGCTESGQMERNCMRCGAEETKPIAATGHDWSTWATIYDASCTADGRCERYCKNCSLVESDILPALGHNYVSGTCTRCGAYDPDYYIAHGDCGVNLTWTLDAAGTLTVSGTGELDNSSWNSVAAKINRVVIRDGVTSIGNYAFYGCSSLTSVTIPDSVTSIGDGAFSGCTGLTDIGDCAFFRCTTIPDSVTNIGRQAFSGCSSLTSVTIGNGVTSIDDDTFERCTGLTSITIPDSVTSIGDGAFRSCTGLTSITIPGGVTSIGHRAFESCTGLANITVPDSVTSIGNYAFNGCTSLTSITIPDSVTSIGDGAFYVCTELTSITIPDSVTSIGNHTFGGCTNLTSITIPDSVTSIGYGAFRDCTELTSITIPDGITSIGDWAFVDCTGLTSITIPGGVTCIGDGAFSGCTGLTSITIPDSVTSIGFATFRDCTALTLITVSANNPNYSCDGLGVLFNKGKTELICYPGGKTGDYIIPGGVTCIGDSAFSGCTGLTSVYFKGDAPEIGFGVFQIWDTGTLIVIPGLTLYYVEGKDGWTTPEWNGYPTATWDGVNVPHTHKYQSVVTAPTCTEKGYTTYTCVCGDSYTDSYVSALGHAWDGGKVTTAPTAEREGVRTFTCTRCGATKTEAIAKLPSSAGRFGDVEESAYYAAAVNWAVAANVTNGTSATTFSPDATCTRGQIVTFLWRAAGQPAPSGAANPFSDVKESAYYYNAVLWAVEKGITAGTSETTFSPDEGCTRGQVATFLWRYESMPDNTTRNPFTDIRTSAYYYGAVLWAVENGITNGTSATTFEPEATCTRGQIVTFLYRDIVK